MKITKRRGILALVALGVLQFSGAEGQEGIWQDVKPLEDAESSGINGPTFDRGPDLSADGLELFFDSNRADGQDDWNLFVATRAALDEPFGNVRALDELNTTDSERAAHISADGLALYFTGDRGNTDLYLARRAGPGAPFGAREKLGPGVNTEFSESQPNVSVDGLELYFSSDRPGGAGSNDLYVATRNAVDQAFGNVLRLDALSTTSFESSPDISADGLTLFFFRNPGPVSAQIWMATRESTADDFANPPINLGPSINTGFTFAPDISPDWPADRATLYYTLCVSNSDCDLYQATWFNDPPEALFTVEEEASFTVDFDATSSTPGDGHVIESYEWDFGDQTSAEGDTVSHTYSSPGSYHVRLTVADERDLRIVAEEKVIVSMPSGDVAPWTAQDVGEVTGPGAARFDESCLVVQGAPGNISVRADRFHYVSQPRGGNFSMITRVADWPNVARFARLGLMVREGFANNARHGSSMLEKEAVEFRHRFFRRSEAGGSTSSSPNDQYESPELWLRIDRRGDTIFGFVSENGTDWSEPDTVELPGLADEVQVGIAASGQTPAGPWSIATLCEISLVEIRPHFLRGDCNGDRKLDISDGAYNLNSLFGGGKTSNCVEACNANDDLKNDVSDAVYVFNFLFGDGAPPSAPYPDCDEDPDPAATLGCGRFACE